MGSETLGKKRQLFFFLLPFASLSPKDFTTECTDRKIFFRNTDKLLLEYAETFRKVNIYLKCFKFELVEQSAGLPTPEKQLNQLIYAGIHLSSAKSSAGSSQNQSGNLIKMKTVVAKYSYKVNLTYCKNLGGYSGFYIATVPIQRNP